MDKETDLVKAKQCSEWVSQYKNSMAKETSEIIDKLIQEVLSLRKSSADDWKYACEAINDRNRLIDEANNSYQCGEL